MSLPPDAVASILEYCDVSSLSAACLTSRGNDHLDFASHSDRAWTSELYARWPPTSLFRLKSRVLACAAGCPRRACALRATASRRDVDVVAREYRLVGFAVDDADGNKTPVTALAHARADLSFAGSAELARGSLRNAAVTAAWSGQLSAWISPGAAKRLWQLSFDETSPNNVGAFRYTGLVAPDGCSVAGTFRHTVFYKLTGTFELAICAATVDPGQDPGLWLDL